MSSYGNDLLSNENGLANFADLTVGQTSSSASSSGAGNNLFSVSELVNNDSLTADLFLAYGAIYDIVVRALVGASSINLVFNYNLTGSVAERSDVVNCGYNSTTISADTTGSKAGSGAGGLGSLRILNIVILHSTSNGTSVGHVATNTLSGFGCISGAGSIVVGGVFTKGVTQSSDFLLLYSEFTANGALHAGSQTSLGASRSGSSNELRGVAGSRNFFLSYSDFTTDFALLTSSQTGLSASRSSRFNYHEIMSESGQHFENFDFLAALIGALYVDATIVETVSFFGNGICIIVVMLSSLEFYKAIVSVGIISCNSGEVLLHSNCIEVQRNIFSVFCNYELDGKCFTGSGDIRTSIFGNNSQNVIAIDNIVLNVIRVSVGIALSYVSLAILICINRSQNLCIVYKGNLSKSGTRVIFNYYFNL